MLWPMGPGPVLVVAALTVAVSWLSVRNARRMEILTTGAELTGNPDIVFATQRRVSRSWDRHRAYVLPTVCFGMALLITQAVACFAVVLPH